MCKDIFKINLIQGHFCDCSTISPMPDFMCMFDNI